MTKPTDGPVRHRFPLLTGRKAAPAGRPQGREAVAPMDGRWKALQAPQGPEGHGRLWGRGRRRPACCGR